VNEQGRTFPNTFVKIFFISPSFVNYKNECTRLASDKVYQLVAHGRWFSPGTPASSTTKSGHHDIAEILLKVALNTKIQIQNSNSFIHSSHSYSIIFNKDYQSLHHVFKYSIQAPCHHFISIVHTCTSNKMVFYMVIYTSQK